VYILDVPADKTKKVDRQKEVVSDAEQCAEDIIADIKNGGNIFLFAQDYEVVNATTTPLEEETKNVLSGVLLDLSVAIPYEWDACNAPIDGVEPGGTEVTYARRGVLRMLTLDGTTDVTSVRTINVTNGTLTDDGDGVVTLDTGGVDTLAGLTDVDVTGVTDGQVLKYDDATGEWIPANDQSATSLGNLDDVSITTPADRESLIYDGDNWVNDNLSKADVGLANVDNTSDANKPVSTATQTALDAKADTSSVPTELNDLSDVTITGTPTGNQALIFDGTANVFKSLPNFTNRFEDEAENNKQAITPFAERVYTVKADGDGIFIDAESDTPTAGKVIKRKIYQKTGFLESGAVIGDFTLIHTFADDTAYSATESTFEGFRDGDTYGTPPFTLIQTWEEVTAAPSFTGLLNETYGSGAEAAYSTRRLNGNYSGDCMTIRRASDGTTQSIGFVDEEIDESAIETFCTGTTCTVQVWRDQSGNGNDAEQTTTGSQPTIYTGGALIKEGGRLALQFNSDKLGEVAISLTQPFTSTSVFKLTGTPSFSPIFGSRDGSGVKGSFVARTSNWWMQSTTLADTGKAHDNSQHLFYSVWDGASSEFAQDGSSLTTLNAGTTDWTNLAINSRGTDGPASGQDGLWQELIFWNSDKSTDRTDIEGNISTYFQSAKLLDESFGSGAEAAYSTRQLRRDQTECMIIRRASDSTTTTIGFVDGDIDEAAIETFCTGTTCTVYQWLDQSGNGNTATAAAPANEPTIYTGGALVKQDGRVGVDFDGSANVLVNTTVSITDYDFSIVNVNVHPATNGVPSGLYLDTSSNTYYHHLAVGGSGTLNNRIQARVGGTTGQAFTDAIEGQRNLNYLNFISATNRDITVNGVESGSNNTNVAFTAPNSFSIGAMNDTSPANYFDGIAQELILFGATKSGADQTSIESNIGDYYTQNTPLLDTYSGAAAAYSLRLLDSTYTGALVNVWNGTSYADIYPNVFGELDTVALADHCGSNDGFIRYWYDQSSNSNDATQTATANMPKIYDGTTGVVTDNGKPCLQYDTTGTDTFDMATGLTSVQSVFEVLNSTRTISQAFLLGDASTNEYVAGVGKQLLRDAADCPVDIKDGTTRLDGVQVDFTTTLRPNSQALISMVHDSALGNVSQLTEDRSNGRSWDGNIQEIILYENDQSANLSDIEDNINTFYSIY
jgi:hypothetical protein